VGAADRLVSANETADASEEDASGHDEHPDVEVDAQASALHERVETSRSGDVHFR
jgi:hypothetical protein